MESRTDTQNWPDLAIGLYDKLTGRDAEITYDFENMRVAVPGSTGEASGHAQWKVDGTLRIRTRDQSASAS